MNKVMTIQEFDALVDELRDMDFTQSFDDLFKEVETKVPAVPEKAPKTAAAPKKRKSVINDSELETMFADIQVTFTGSFKNKDLGDLLEKWQLSARQTPSRLKKLVDAGLLKDLGGSPKSYQVA